MKAKVSCMWVLKSIKYPVIALCLFGCLSQFAIAEDDDYLSLISSEAEKTDDDQYASEDPAVEADDSLDEIKLQEFEKVLKEKYIGSYLVYRRLAQSSKNALSKDYEAGVPIDEIRKKIIALYSKD